ncbi:6-phosphofructokinase [Halteromyces radiatus]|uniref:6-phosphofructokinase n=1 Tax=Halteromyces radiatus TaxID=101107 RepID=UPI0022211A64|nr:6-phosphofructokinase [Halteromyces radiatus]KAI8086139.1 6-phosphofructokinase [Halteromyces radiatus]
MATSALGLSYSIISSKNEEAYGQTVKFYELLGFDRVIGNHESEGETELQQTWLRLKGGKQTSSLIIKIVLNPEVTLHRQEPLTTDKDWGLEDTLFVLNVPHLQPIMHTLTERDIPFQETTTSILIQDPNNNVIALSSKLNPVSEQPQQQLQEQRRKKIGILTSGGDASGMNACVRATVLYGISKGCDVYAVYEGYQGLVDGGDYIKKMDWRSVTGYLSVGGTSIGTARCMPFKTREGRLKAAENLIKNGIDSLIVCGGDGSLTGADVFRSEWGGLVAELFKTKRITEEEATIFQHLTIVGLVGSIDNDMSSTDITIGAVTSLHRICEAVDSVDTTALSHSRAFVIEVMGRHCGWLALMAGIATGADFVFIPERPPAEEDWETAMCNVAKRHRELGKRKTIIIVAEGALDKHLNPIKVDHIKDILSDRLGLDTRVTILGHTQRGGSPCAFDRILGTVQSVAAVDAVLASTPDKPSPMIGMNNNKVTTKPLMDAVKLTHEVAKAIESRNFERAMELRDPQFLDEYKVFNVTTILDDNSIELPDHQRLRIAILHIGAPAGGMNSATRAAVRYALNRGHTVYGVANGFSGLVRGCFEQLNWMDVDGWTTCGGSYLGTNRAVPGKDVDMGMVAYRLQKMNIQAVMLVGGFEAYASLVEIDKVRYEYPSLCIPMCLIPATISNNVPGTDFSLGCDTSLNVIVSASDAIVQSAQSSRRRVFVIEVQGGRSGFLAVEGGLAVGACAIYIPEEGIDLPRLQGDVQFLKGLYDTDDPQKSEGRVILRTESVSKTYTTKVISEILEDEGGARFDSRTAVLGHIQQGNTPSPLDRIRASRLAIHSIEFFEKHTRVALDKQQDAVELATGEESIAVIGLCGAEVHAKSIKTLLPTTDMKNRKPHHDWWHRDRALVDILSGRSYYSCIE